jgi:hypothetical protein
MSKPANKKEERTISSFGSSNRLVGLQEVGEVFA